MTSRSRSDDDSPAGDELVYGRRATQGTWSPDWVELAPGIDSHAARIYRILRMRLNKARKARGDYRVWPGTASLAHSCGLERSGSVSPYLAQLEELGAIDIHRRGMPRRNVYVVHDTPPPGYQGPLTIQDWDQVPTNRLAIAAIKAKDKARNDAARAKAKAAADKRTAQKAQLSPDTRSSGYQAPPGQMSLLDTPSSGYQDAPSSAHLDTPSGRDHDAAKNVDHSSKEPPRKEPPPTHVPHQPRAPHDSHQPHPREEEEPEPPDGDFVLQAVLARVPRRARPGPAQHQALRRLADAALDAGWTVDALLDRLTQGDLLDNTAGVYAVLQHRLSPGKGLPDEVPPPTPVAPAPAPDEPPRLVDEWQPPCGLPGCDPVTRTLVDEEGRTRFDVVQGVPKRMHCPRCSPYATSGPSGPP